MAFRFFTRKKIAPGITLNFSKSGVSASFGPRGLKATIGPRGLRTTAGIPGTGMYYTKLHTGKRGRRGGRKAAPPAPTPAERLDLNFFQRLVTPAEEEALVDGCRELVAANEVGALQHLRKATQFADGAYLAGFLSIKLGHLNDALRYLGQALDQAQHLGTHLNKYGVQITTSIMITEHIRADLLPSRPSVLLGLVECHQLRKDWQRAVDNLKELRTLAPHDMVVLLSLCELVDTAYGARPDAAKRVVDWTQDVDNESELHAAVLLYKARALRRLNLQHAARDTLTQALRRKKDRADELINALHYDRGEVYEALGRKRQAQGEFERIYATDPDYEDVAEKLAAVMQ